MFIYLYTTCIQHITISPEGLNSFLLFLRRKYENLTCLWHNVHSDPHQHFSYTHINRHFPFMSIIATVTAFYTMARIEKKQALFCLHGDFIMS